MTKLQTTLVTAAALPLYAEKWREQPLVLDTLPPITRAEFAAAHFDSSRAALAHFTPAHGGWMPEYLSAADLEQQALGTAAWLKTLGIGAGTRVVVAFGYHVFAGGWLFHEALQRCGALVLPHGPGEAERLAGIATQHGFDVLISNPTFALRLAEAGARFKLLIAAGEPFSSVPGFRERVEAAIGGVAVDCFGMSETGIVAGESLARDGLEPLAEMAHLEVLDPTSLEPTPNGEKGELVVTTFARELMPLVRFRTGDLCLVERTKNGLRFPNGMIGRVDEMVKVKGIKLYPKEIGAILASLAGVDSRHYQLAISRGASGTDVLELRVLAAVGTDFSSLEPHFRNRLGFAMNTVVAVDKIEGGMVLDGR
jgi:phenylacetate-CoA ligase